MISLVGSFRSTAQPAFSTSGEIRVSQAATGKSHPMITVRSDGNCMVVWADASQLLHPDLSFDGTNSTFVRGGYVAGYFSDGWWGIVQVNGYHFGTWMIADGFRQDFYLTLYDHLTFTTLPKLFSVESFQNVNQGVGWNGWLAGIQSIENDDRFFLCYNLGWIQDGDPTGYNRTDHGIDCFDKRTKQQTQIISRSLGRKTSVPVEVNNFVISPIKKNTFALLKNEVAGVGEENGLKIPYHRYVDVYSVFGDTLSHDAYVDAFAHAKGDYAERIVLGDENDAYLFRRHNHGDSIFALQASLDGTIRMPDKFIVNGVAGDSLYAEYEVGQLSNNRYFIVWTGIDAQKDTNVFIALLDKDMNIPTQSMRVNSEATGQQCRPSIATKGDSIYVTWLDTRSGAMHVYLRLITLDQITATDAQDQPSAFGITGVYPNPVASSASIRFSVDAFSPNGTTLTVYDVFGREVKRLVAGQLSSGVHSAQFTRDGLPSGMYSLVLRSGALMQRKTIVLVR